MSEEDTTLSKPDLEVENLKRQNDKLGFEIEELRSETPVVKNIRRLLPIITGLISVIAIPVAVYKYVDEQRAARDEKKQSDERQNKEREENEKATRLDLKRETAKPFWDRQLGLYFDAVEKAAIIATSNDPAIRRLAEERFWVLYWGPLAAVEDVGLVKNSKPEIERAMVKFGNLLKDNRTIELKQDEMRQAALDLAHEIRNAVGPAFDVELTPLNNTREQANK